MTSKHKSYSLLAQIDKYLLSSELKGLDTRAKHFYPTSASAVDQAGQIYGACLRKAAFDYYGVEPTNPHDAKTFYTFEAGKQLESMFINWFKIMGIYVSDHIKFYDPYFHISGEVDCILREKPGSSNIYICEIKTSHGYQFKSLVVSGSKNAKPAPKDEHIMQCMIYLDNYINIPYAKLIYLGRDDFARTEYTIRLVQKSNHIYPEITHLDGYSIVDTRLALDSIYNRYKDLGFHIKKGSLPERDYFPIMTQEQVDKQFEAGEISKNKRDNYNKKKALTTQWQCTYCNYLNLCRGIVHERIDNFMNRYRANEFKPYDFSNSTESEDGLGS